MAILTYHHIGQCPQAQREHRGLWVAQDLFDRQLRWLLSRGHRPLTLQQMLDGLQNGELPSRWFSVTFDDGWRDNCTAALPVLKAHGVPATVFVATAHVRTQPAGGQWDERLSAGEMKEMETCGVQFGSHTRTHPRLTSLDDDAIRAEVNGSLQDLGRMLGSPPAWFAYPYGNFSRRVAAIVQEAGYSGAVSAMRDNRPNASQRYWLPRVMVMDDSTPARLGHMLSGFYHFIHRLKNRRRWRDFA